MSEPPAGQGASWPRRAANAAAAPCIPGRDRSSPGAGSPAAAGAAAAGAAAGAGGGLGGSPGGSPETLPAAGGLDCEPWVREKVLFLLHPERWLGTPGDPARGGVAGGEELFPAAGAARDPDCPSLFPRAERVSRGRVGAARPGAPPRSVLVRVVDYQATEEVLWTAWTKGLTAARTQERSVTAITFRTGRE
ncbi:unnamed protein product [Nyctereutes procyonoides]|uniref:(raccoon dog) hypothetical protein n=1 Tax=Nyctereutes procyonoides TaxID=34880 RepID=A0A811YK57_NYCPR|nr:uncharacterized protein C6orf141 homolog [Nyctereutes procyonoides]XP_055186829.1 uncharacterized protein C6orf141 homolog [Nyctereutes procyonoides]XP_055186830.1 uncharacterized protein C6orf141 homolog [Nyctereutes procyonoides]CAD7677920.1 unnamed protein product [Nyctereutes procyonoides]